MATAKAKVEETIEEVKAPATVTIRLPRERKDQEDVHVAVNFKDYVIRRGIDVEVPVEVAEVLRHREEMLDSIMDGKGE